MDTQIKRVDSCSHSCTAHVFLSPCCKKLNLIKKIAIVAFHILTLFIPFIISKVTSCCFPRSPVEPKKTGENLQKTGVESVQNTLKNIPEISLPKPTPVVVTAASELSDDANCSKEGDEASVISGTKNTDEDERKSPVQDIDGSATIAPAVDAEQLSEPEKLLTPKAINPSPIQSTEGEDVPKPDVNKVEPPTPVPEPIVVIAPKPTPIQKAFTFADQLLEEHRLRRAKTPTINSESDSGVDGTSNCKNNDTGFIMNLQKKFDAEFNEALKASDNPWKEKKVLEIADAMMKVSYYAACKVLEELPTYIKKLNEDGKKKTEQDVFRDVETYQYQAFEHFTYVYHSIRSGKHWGEIMINSEPKYAQECWKYSNTVDGVSEFYKDGTMQNAWRTLYNDYCDRFALHVSHLDFNPRRVTKDLVASVFKPAPEFHPNMQNIDIYQCNPKPESHVIDLHIALTVVKETSNVTNLYGTLDLHVFADKKLGFRRAPKMSKAD